MAQGNRTPRTRRQLVAWEANRHTAQLRPFASVRDATLSAIEQAIKSTDNGEKRKAWIKLHEAINKREFDHTDF